MSFKRLISDFLPEREILGAFLLGAAGALLLALVYIFFLQPFWRLNHFVERDLGRQSLPTDSEIDHLKQLLSLREEMASLDKQVSDQIQSQQQGSTGSDQVVSIKQTKKSPNEISIAALGSQTERAFQNVRVEGAEMYLPSGTVFKARLLTPIKTSVEESFVLAETTNEYRIDSVRRIPKETRLLGRAKLNPVLKGVVVEFNRMINPERTQEADLSALALSRTALPELEGFYVRDDAEKYGSALAFGFLGGFSEAAKTRRETPFGTFEEPSLSNQVLSGVSTASFRVAEEMIRDLRERSVEYVILPAGVPIFVALTQKLEMKPEGGPY